MKTVFIIFCMVIIAGCSQPIVQDGIVITSFYTDPKSVDSGELFQSIIEFENVGETTARNNIVKLFAFGATNERQVADLSPADSSLNRPAEFKIIRWNMQAPVIGQNDVTERKLRARVEYDYTTSYVINIPVISRDEYRLGSDQPVTESTTTVGPLYISITGEQPIIILPENGKEVYVYSITIKNTGRGVPITDDVTGRIIGTINIVGNGVTAQNCFGKEGTNFDIETRIRDEKSVTVTCTLEIDRAVWQQIPRGSVLMIINLYYKYFTEAETTLTIKGPREP